MTKHKNGHFFELYVFVHSFYHSKINTSPCGTEWHQLIPVGFVIKQNPETTNQSEALATPWHLLPTRKERDKNKRG